VNKNIYMLRSMEDELHIKVAGIYCIPCEYGKVYVGQMGRTTGLDREVGGGTA
jgi:hypothetical protein